MVLPRQPERLGSVLAGLLEEAGGKDLAVLLEVRRFWPDWVGPEMAARARPLAFERGVLTICVEHAVFSQELRLRESELKRAFTARTGRRLERLAFRSDRAGFEDASPSVPRERDLRVESADSRPEVGQVAGIDDPELAEALASLRSHLREKGGDDGGSTS